MKSESSVQSPHSNEAAPVVKKKRKKSRDKMTTELPAKMSPNSQHKNKPESETGGDYTVGQIAALLSGHKESSTSQRPAQGNKSELLAMFGSVGSSASGLTGSTRAVFAPLVSSGGKGKMTGEKKQKGREDEAKQNVYKERMKQRQQHPEAANETQTADKDSQRSDTANLKMATTGRVALKERPRPNLEESDRTVFVGNLPMSFDKKKLRKLFHKFGEIKSIRFRSVAPSDPDLPKRVIAHTKQFHPDRDSINSYVVFQSEEGAQKALKRNGKLVDKHHIRVDLAANSRKHDTKHSVFLGNLPFGVSDDVIREHFEDCGTIENVRVIRDAKTGLGKGFGYLLFAEDVSVEFALKQDGSRMAGRDIRVQRATKQKQIALNAMKRIQKKDDSKAKKKGSIPGRDQSRRGKTGHRVKPGQVKPGRAMSREGKPRKTKSGQMRSKGRSQIKKGKPAGHAKKRDKVVKGKRK